MRGLARVGDWGSGHRVLEPQPTPDRPFLLCEWEDVADTELPVPVTSSQTFHLVSLSPRKDRELKEKGRDCACKSGLVRPPLDP